MQHSMEWNGTERNGTAICYRTKRVHPLGLAEPNTKHGELRYRKIGNFITNGKRILKSLNSMARRLQAVQGKTSRHHG